MRRTPLATPPRGANRNFGTMTTPGTLTPNIVQQDYFVGVTTRVILPLFRERDRPFALGSGPPWRTRLLRVGASAHVLILGLHHYVGDGISIQLWLEELDAHYTHHAQAGGTKIGRAHV